MTRYLVTGGAGFIGSNIVETLVKQGAIVRVADNFSTGRRENLAGVADQIELFEGDLADLEFARYAVRGVDYVLHQAAIPSVPRSVADPLGSNRAGVTGTLNLLVTAKEAGVKRLVFASSSSVYGESLGTAKHEGLKPAPLSPYAVSKLAAEQYCMSFHTVYGFEAVALRYFNVFGPRQDPTSQYSAVIPKFITALLAGKAPTIYGDGEQTRDFTFVGNVIAANLHALTAPDAPGQYFNIAMGQATSLNQLVDMLNELLGVNIKPAYASPRPGDIKHSTAEVSKIRDVLGFTPAISLLDGLRQTVAWYQEGKREVKVSIREKLFVWLKQIEKLWEPLAGLSESGWRATLALVVLTIVVRLPAIWLIATLPQQALVSDSPRYHQLAVNLLERGLFSSETAAPYIPEQLRTPGYPVFLASVYATCNEPCFARAVFVQQTLLTVIAVLFTYAIALRVLPSRPAAWAAAMWYSLSPITIVINSYVLAETLYICLMLASVWILLRAIWGHNWWLLALGVVVFGLATLVRPIGQAYFIFLIGIAIWFTSGGLRRRLATAVVLVAAFVLTLAPWSWHIYQTTGTYRLTTLGTDFILFVNTAYLDADLYGLTYDQARDGVWKQSAEYSDSKGVANPTETQVATWRQELAFQKIMAHPFRYAWVHLKISANGLRPGLSFLTQLIESKDTSYDTSKVFSDALLVDKLRVFLLQRPLFIVVGGWLMLYTGLVYGFGLVGSLALIAKRQWWLLTFLVGPLVWTLLIASGTAEARIRMPTEPFMAMLTIVGLQAVWLFIKARLKGSIESIVA